MMVTFFLVPKIILPLKLKLLCINRRDLLYNNTRVIFFCHEYFAHLFLPVLNIHILRMTTNLCIISSFSKLVYKFSVVRKNNFGCKLEQIRIGTLKTRHVRMSIHILIPKIEWKGEESWIEAI